MGKDTPLSPARAAAAFNRGDKSEPVRAALEAWAGGYACFVVNDSKIDWAASQEAREDLEAAGLLRDPHGPHGDCVNYDELFRAQRRAALRDPSSGRVTLGFGRHVSWLDAASLTKRGVSMDAAQIDWGPVIARQDGQERLQAILHGRAAGLLDAQPNSSSRRELARLAAVEQLVPELARALALVRALKASDREALEALLSPPATVEERPAPPPPPRELHADCLASGEPCRAVDCPAGREPQPQRRRYLLIYASDDAAVARRLHGHARTRADIELVDWNSIGPGQTIWVARDRMLATVTAAVILCSASAWSDEEAWLFLADARARVPIFPALIRACGLPDWLRQLTPLNRAIGTDDATLSEIVRQLR